MTDSTDTDILYGPQTMAAIANFGASGEQMPAALIRALAAIKAEAAVVNAQKADGFDHTVAAAVRDAADEVAAGIHDDQFPIDVFQTGSGTSTNMNVNEVVATLATQRLGRDVHPNDHVNASQSTNDTFPSALRIACLQALHDELLPALATLERELGLKSREFGSIIKAGRTHHMDATPILLGDEFRGYSAQIAALQRRLREILPELGELPLGGTATGNGLNAPPGFGAAVADRLSKRLELVEICEAPDHFSVQGAQDVLVELSGRLRTAATAITKIANDLRLMASGPRTGLGELKIRHLQTGSSIMPGKTNPVICEVATQVAAQVIGNDAAVAFAGSQGVLELNTYLPVIARNLLSSLTLLAHTASSLATQCVALLEVDLERCRDHAEQTLATAAVLNPVIGYDLATEIVTSALRSGKTVKTEVEARDLLTAEQIKRHLDLDTIAAGTIKRLQD
ncbi:MAG: fumarate hydratase class II [Candidatus Poriferisodalaceae bacterium]|jgi:fumarate hydratase class II